MGTRAHLLVEQDGHASPLNVEDAQLHVRGAVESEPGLEPGAGRVGAAHAQRGLKSRGASGSTAVVEDTKPIAVNAGWISGFAMKESHRRPLRAFSIMPTMGS